MMPRVFALSAFLLIFSALYLTFLKSSDLKFSALRHKLLWVLIAWLLVSSISLLFAKNPVEGIYDIIKAFFVITTVLFGVMIFSNKENWVEYLLKFVVVSSIITSIVGFTQYFMWVYGNSGDQLNDARNVIYLVVGVMSHKNLYSISLFMMLPFTLYGVFLFRKLWRVLSSLSALSLLILIFILQSRAVWLGFMMASAFLVVLVLVYSKALGVSKKVKLFLATIIFLGIVSLGVIVFLMGGNSQNRYILQLNSIVDKKSPHNIHRLNIWNATTDMIKDKPLLGCGPLNWKLQVGNYFQGRFFLEEQTNWHRPHNDFLWVYAEKGPFGFILYLMLFGFAFFYLLKVIASELEVKFKVFALLLIFLLIGYLTASAFDFPYERVFHQTFLGLIFASSISLYNKVEEVKSLSINRFIVLIPLILVFGFGTSYGYNVTRQEVLMKKARVELEIINKGILPRLSSLPPDQLKNAKAMLQRKWLEVGKYAQQAEYKFKKLDNTANPISYYRALAYINLGDNKNALKYCLQAVSEHPGSLKALNSIGAVYYNLKQYENAEMYLTKSLQIFPSHDALQNLSATYYQLGQYKKAYDLLINAPKDIMTPSLENNLKVIEMKIKEGK
jgi:O-antigen ligase